MTQIWKIKIRKSIKKEFPQDLMMQELHEIRAQLANKYKPTKFGLGFQLKQPAIKEKLFV